MTSALPPILPLLGFATLFGISTVLRLSFYVGFVERPISIAIIWGAVTGDWTMALGLGIFFELFWMDLIGAGTYIPPNANLSLLLCLFVSSSFASQGMYMPAPPLVLIVLSIPLAFAGTWIEQHHRHKLISLHEQLVEKRQMDKPIPITVISWAILQLWFKETLLFILLGSAVYCLLAFPFLNFHQFPGQEKLDWSVLWLTATLGGVLSLRTRRAVTSLAITLAIFCVLLLHG